MTTSAHTNWFLLGFTVLATLAAGCKKPPTNDAGSLDAAVTVEPSRGVRMVVISPTTGEAIVNTTLTAKPGTPEARDELRRALGMGTQAEADAVTQYITATKLNEVGLVRECLYVAQENTFGYLDPTGKMWIGTKYHAGRFPILGHEGEFVKTVVRDGDTPDGSYTIIYFRAARMSPNFAETEWAKAGEKDGHEYAEICDRSTLRWKRPAFMDEPTAAVPTKANIGGKQKPAGHKCQRNRDCYSGYCSKGRHGTARLCDSPPGSER